MAAVVFRGAAADAPENAPAFRIGILIYRDTRILGRDCMKTPEAEIPLRYH